MITPEPPPGKPPWDGEQQITESQLEMLRLEASQHDLKLVIKALYEHGGITVVPDP